MRKHLSSKYNSCDRLIVKIISVAIITLFTLISLPGVAQSNIRLNNYWENTYYINPASIYSEYKLVASVAAREQWIRFPGAPRTGYFSLAYRIFTNKTQATQIGQVGIKFFYDKIGFTSTQNISASCSYSLRVNYNQRLNMGFAGKFQNYSYDMSESNSEIIIDPATYAIETKWSRLNLDFGIEYIGRSFLVGASGQNIISAFYDKDKLQTNTNFVYGLFQTDWARDFDLRFGVCGINNKNIYQGEINMSLVSKVKNHNYLLGISYRTNEELGVLWGIDLSRAIRLACCYEYHVGGINNESSGTPEVMLVWKMNKLRNCDCKDTFK